MIIRETHGHRKPEPRWTIWGSWDIGWNALDPELDIRVNITRKGLQELMREASVRDHSLNKVSLMYLRTKQKLKVLFTPRDLVGILDDMGFESPELIHARTMIFKGKHTREDEFDAAFDSCLALGVMDLPFFQIMLTRRPKPAQATTLDQIFYEWGFTLIAVAGDLSAL